MLTTPEYAELLEKWQEEWDRQHLEVIVAFKKRALHGFVCEHKRPHPQVGETTTLPGYDSLVRPYFTPEQIRKGTPLGSFCTICLLPDWTTARTFLKTKKGGPFYACKECRSWFVVKGELGQFPVTVPVCRDCGGGVVPRSIRRRLGLV